MFDDLDLVDDPKKVRRSPTLRVLRTSTITNVPRRRKKVAGGHAGAHRRRNKHWSW